MSTPITPIQVASTISETGRVTRRDRGLTSLGGILASLSAGQEGTMNLFDAGPTLLVEAILESTVDIRQALLVVRCQLREEDALDDLVGLWHQRLWRYTRTLVPSDEAANEAIQNVWLRILRGLPALRAPELFPSWAYRIAYRAAMDQLRMKYADALKEPLEDDVDGGRNTEVELERKLDVEKLYVALAELPLMERNVLSLFYLEELSLVEISGVVDAPVGTVKSRLFRARRMLRKVMNHA